MADILGDDTAANSGVLAVAEQAMAPTPHNVYHAKGVDNSFLGHAFQTATARAIDDTDIIPQALLVPPTVKH